MILKMRPPMEKFKLTIATQEKKLFEGEAERVTVPGEDGQMTLFAGHAPLFSTLTGGEVKVATGAGAEAFDISGGFVEVSENYVTVLAKRPLPEKSA